jgi:hypothetical protein
MRNEYPWLPGGNPPDVTFSSIAPARPSTANPAFPSTGAPTSTSLTSGHGSITRPVTVSELAACWPASLRGSTGSKAGGESGWSPRRARRADSIRDDLVLEPEVLLSPSMGALCDTAMNKVANRNVRVWHGATETGA